jgi:hypothetical protein
MALPAVICVRELLTTGGTDNGIDKRDGFILPAREGKAKRK